MRVGTRPDVALASSSELPTLLSAEEEPFPSAPSPELRRSQKLVRKLPFVYRFRRLRHGLRRAVMGPSSDDLSSPTLSYVVNNTFSYPTSTISPPPSRLHLDKPAVAPALSEVSSASDEQLPVSPFDSSWLGSFDDRSEPERDLFDDENQFANSTLIQRFADDDLIEDDPLNYDNLMAGCSGAGSHPDAAMHREDKDSPLLADRVSVLLAAPLSGSGQRPETFLSNEPELSPPRSSHRDPDSVRRVASALTTLATPPNESVPSNLRTVKDRETIIPLVVRTLAEFRREPEVVNAALLALTHFASTPSYRLRISACGGIEAVIDVKRTHSLEPWIQSQGCLMLANAAHHMPTIKPKAIDAGALLVVVAAMSVHQRVEEVQAWGCLALRNLTRVKRDQIRDPHCCAAAVEVIANAMERMPLSRTVQMQAMVALTNVAALSEIAKSRVGSVSAVRVVVDALQRNILHAGATDVALTCISVLVTDIDNQRDAVKHGVVHGITLALRQHDDDHIIAAKAGSCIRFISYQLSHRMLLGTGDTLPALIDALTFHLQDGAPVRSLREIMHAIGNTVAGLSANKERARGAVIATTQVLNRHVGGQQSSILLVEDSCRLLYALVADCPSNQDGAAEIGLLSALLEALREHSCDSARIAEHATAVFVVLAKNDAILPDVQRGASDLASILRRAKTAHADVRGVHRQTRALVHALGIAEEDMALAWPSGLGDPWAERHAARRSDILTRLRSSCI